MRKKVLSSTLAAIALICGLANMASAYPERPDSARVQYELWYLPVRLVSAVSTILWDVPTGAFQDGIKGAIGFTKMVARNLGKEDGVYELVAGGLTGGPVGLVQGALYGTMHGFGYGANHGFMGYPSPYNGSHRMLFQGIAYRVPYDEDY